MFSYQHAGITPDVVLLGKSLGGGLPVSAVVGPAAVVDAGTALFTACGNSVGSAAALAVVEETERLGLADRSARNGAILGDALRAALAGVDIVADIRGLGMIHGVELVTDRASNRPAQPLAAKVVYRAWQLGLTLYYAGNWGNVLEITPPLILDDDEVRHGVDLLRRAIADVLDGAVSYADVAPFAGW